MNKRISVNRPLALASLVIMGAAGVSHALDRVRAETGVDLAAATFGVSGAGVIVAIMDRGIDWESNDFRNDDGTTRIAYIFDLSDDSGADDPGNTYGRGTIYTRQQINQALTDGATLATRDAVGHGTTTTGIAAGNGRNLTDRRYRGVAPNATIISVKVTGGAPAHGNEPAEPDFYVGRPGIDVAIDFVLDKAQELSMPVVMLLNLGSIGGPSDGTSALSRKIDESVGPDHPGVVFVTGTGDDGGPSKTQNRAAGDVPDGGTADLRFALDKGAGRLEVWYDENQQLAVSVDTPIGTLGPYPASQFNATGTGARMSHYRKGGEDWYGSTNGKRLLLIDFDGAAGAGEYLLRLTHSGSSTGSAIHFDASLNTPFGEEGRFLNFATPGSIWDLATTFRNVAPNSYVIRTNWTDIDGVQRELTGEGDVGRLWTGSSTGPTVDGRIGVDVSAPGDRVVAPYAPRSHWASLRYNLIADGGGLYGMAGAVSAAAPVVTGIIALMLEMDPTLDAASVKSILQRTARADEFTGKTPNTLWGYGKVDAYAALLTVRLRTLEDGREDGGAAYGTDDALPAVPTSGSFVPAALQDGSVSSTEAGTTIVLNDGGHFELSDGTRYACVSVDGCTIENGVVTRGTVATRAAGSGDGARPATPVGQGVSVTDRGQILVELAPEDIDPANPLDLAGRSLMFTPADGGYTREVRPLDWEEEADDAERMPGPAKVELEHFRFPFAGREWDSFFYTPRGSISFGKPIPTDYEWPRRFATMPQMLDALAFTPMISALYKPHLSGVGHVSNLPDRVIVSFFAWDRPFAVYGRRPKETFDFQIVLHSDGRIGLNYGPEPQDRDEAFRDGIAGLFPAEVRRTGVLKRIPDAADSSLPAHLDLVETVVYSLSDPRYALVEFTTRGPIRPVPGRESVYMLHVDVDQPWWTRYDRDDRDFLYGVVLHPDGRLEGRWDGARPYDSEAGDNRISLLISLRGSSPVTASVVAATGESDSVTGTWTSGNGAGIPALVDLPGESDATTDLSQPNPRASAAHSEVFRYPMIRDIEEVSCRLVKVLGDEFDFFAFNSQFRVDQQSPGPAHGFAGSYHGNVKVEGIGIDGRTGLPPCDTRLSNTWGYPVWMQASTVVDEGEDRSGEGPYDAGLTQFAHELGHTWLAFASYARNGERMPLADPDHWSRGLHAPAAYPWRGMENGSIMGGNFWRENGDGTFSPVSGWGTRGGGFSWLDLYMMGLAAPDEVPDMFILRNLQEAGGGWGGPHTAEKEVITMEEVLAAMGPRIPAPEWDREAFNIGFVYFLLPGQEPDAGLLREHARYRDRTVAHWRHITGARGRLTTNIPGHQDYGDTYRTESFNLNRGAFNTRGMAYANGRFYVAGLSDNRVYAYSATGERDETAEFDLHGDNANPEDIVYVNGKLYVLDNTDDKLYAYSATGERDETAEFDLHGDNGDPTGVAYANSRFYVLDAADRVYAYSVTGERDEALEFDLHADNSDPSGIAYAGGRFYILDWYDDKVYAYSATGERDEAAEFGTAGLNYAIAIRYANSRFFIIDGGSDKVYSYPGPADQDGGGVAAETTYEVDDEIIYLPTGVWVPTETYGGSRITNSGGSTVVQLDDGGYFEQGGNRYACRSAGGCEINNREVVSGTIVQTSSAAMPEDTQPSFTGDSRPGAQTYIVGVAIDTLALPEAAGGDGSLSYSLVPEVPGLNFNTATRQLTGTPTKAGAYAMTYTATDEDGDSDTLSFGITVETYGFFAMKGGSQSGPLAPSGCTDGRYSDNPEGNPGLVRDCLALVGFATALTEGGELPDDHVLRQWGVGDQANLASWKGIEISGGRVTAIRLANKQLNGPIPAEVGQLTALTVLDLSSNTLAGAIPSDFAGLANLRRLNLQSNAITDISPLAGVTDLIWLSLSSNEIEDIFPLAGLTHLEAVFLDGNVIADLSPLAGLTGLKTLDLAYNAITDISPLAGLTGLVWLSLSSNEIEDISLLLGLTHLEAVFLDGNVIADLSPLAGLTELIWLFGEENAIVDIWPLAGLISLRGLYFGGNSITDLSPLVGLTNLRGLDLEANAITDISPLLSNNGLGKGASIVLDGNPLSNESRSIHIPALRARGAAVVHSP